MPLSHRARRLLALALILVGLAGPTAAQQTESRITGRVIDQSDAALPGVTVTVTSFTDASLANTDTGIVTFLPGHLPGPGIAVTAGFEFDVPVRFDTDKLDARNVARDPSGLMHAWDAIPIIEIP